MIKAPCKDCEKRHKLCWNTCEPYKEFKRKKEAQNEAMRKTEIETFTIEQVRKQRIKINKNKRNFRSYD